MVIKVDKERYKNITSISHKIKYVDNARFSAISL